MKSSGPRQIVRRRTIGEEALRRFVVVFNYPARKIAFLPAGSTGEAIP